MTDTDTRRLEGKIDEALKTLARLEGFLTPTIAALKDGQAAQSRRSDDHEKRLRALERFKYAWPSTAAISALAALATLAYYLLHH